MTDNPSRLGNYMTADTQSQLATRCPWSGHKTALLITVAPATGEVQPRIPNFCQIPKLVLRNR